jgi:hypothetical protein
MQESAEPVGSPPERSPRWPPGLRGYLLYLIVIVVYMTAIRLINQWLRHRPLIGAFDMFKEPELYIVLAAAIPFFYFMAWLRPRKPEWFTKPLWGSRRDTRR